jgi:hypothetical protein
MAKQFALPIYNVVIDTNAIRGKDEQLLIAPSFSRVWKECTILTTLHLHVPDIVRGERIQQLFKHATLAIKQANSALARACPKSPDFGLLSRYTYHRISDMNAVVLA